MGSYAEKIMTLWINMFCIVVSKIHKGIEYKTIYDVADDAPVDDVTKYNVEVYKAYTDYDSSDYYEVGACSYPLAHAESITMDDVDKIVDAVKGKKPPMEIRKLASQLNLKEDEHRIEATDAAYVIKYDLKFGFLYFEPDEWTMLLPEDKNRQRRYHICAEKANRLIDNIVEDNSPYWYALDMASLESN